jgi:hypothetical protein
MKTTLFIAPAFLAILLSSCVADSSSAAVNGRRNQAGNITSNSQLNQNRIQRANEGEESDHAANLRYNKRDEVLSPLKTANEGLGLLNGIRYGASGIGVGRY